MWFKSYNHFDVLLTDGLTDSQTHTDYSAPAGRAIAQMVLLYQKKWLP